MSDSGGGERWFDSDDDLGSLVCEEPVGLTAAALYARNGSFDMFLVGRFHVFHLRSVSSTDEWRDECERLRYLAAQSYSSAVRGQEGY